MGRRTFSNEGFERRSVAGLVSSLQCSDKRGGDFAGVPTRMKQLGSRGVPLQAWGCLLLKCLTDRNMATPC